MIGSLPMGPLCRKNIFSIGCKSGKIFQPNKIMPDFSRSRAIGGPLRIEQRVEFCAETQSKASLLRPEIMHI